MQYLHLSENVSTIWTIKSPFPDLSHANLKNLRSRRVHHYLSPQAGIQILMGVYLMASWDQRIGYIVIENMMHQVPPNGLRKPLVEIDTIESEMLIWLGVMYYCLVVQLFGTAKFNLN